MTNKQASSKLFGASDTSWLRKIKDLLSERTELMVAGTFFILCTLNTSIILLSLHNLHLEIATAVVRSLGVHMTEGAPPFNIEKAAGAVLDEVQTVSNMNIFTVITLSMLVTVICGYLAARLTLLPTKNALASQKQFIGNIAHELRTPLSIIRANSEIALMGKSGTDDTRALIESNIEELDRISGIINNLLTLNSFRTVGGMVRESVTLADIVRDAMLKFEKLTVSKEIHLDTALDQTVTIWGNKSGLAQICMNVLKNAIIYTPPKGSVFIAITHIGNEWAAIEVRDTGIGIEPEKINRVFEPFYQVDPSRSQNKGSSGLGLAIVSELVKLHHGTITIQSKLGIGTIVRIELPTASRDIQTV